MTGSPRATAAAKTAAKQRWSGHGRAHVDALSAHEAVDGYRIELVEADGSPAMELVDFNDEPYDEED